MSLINDALRKARQAAAEHESRQPAAAFRAPKAYPSRGPRRRSGASLLVLVAAAAGLSGAALVWWIQGEDESAVAAADQAVSATVPGERQFADPGDAAVAPEPSARVAEPFLDEPFGGAATGAATVPDQLPAHTSGAPPVAASQAADESPVLDGPAGRRRVFVLDADLGYASLSLGFIVARSVRPFAEINDAEVYEGSEVAGFVVERIEADRVILRDDRGELVLKVR